MNLKICDLEAGDPPVIAAAFAAVGWDKPESQYVRCLAEQAAGARRTLVAAVDGEFAGYLNVIWQPDYPPLREAGLPEIQDFNVLPLFRRRGIGTRLLAAAEALAAERSPIVGIGVGLSADYGAAQRLYVRRGYVPDGLGVTSHDRPVAPGEAVRLDDALVLHFTKTLPR